MKSRTSLKEALQAVAQQGQDRPAPSLNQLIAYHEGTLSGDERDQMQEYICCRPEAAQFLLHLSHQEEMEELTDEMVAADKEAFFKRLDQLDSESAEASSPAVSASSGHTGSADLASPVIPEFERTSGSIWPSPEQTAYAVATAFFLLAVAAFLWPVLSTQPVPGGPVGWEADALYDTTSTVRSGSPQQAAEEPRQVSEWVRVAFVLQDVTVDQEVHLVLVESVAADGQDLDELPEADSSRVRVMEDGRLGVSFSIEQRVGAGLYVAAVYTIGPKPPVNAEAEGESAQGGDDQAEELANIRNYVDTYQLQVVPGLRR